MSQFKSQSRGDMGLFRNGHGTVKHPRLGVVVREGFGAFPDFFP
jgi:hypothetical protein